MTKNYSHRTKRVAKSATLVLNKNAKSRQIQQSAIESAILITQKTPGSKGNTFG